MTTLDPILLHLLVQKLFSCFRVFGKTFSRMFASFFMILAMTTFERSALSLKLILVLSSFVISLLVGFAFFAQFSKRDILLLVYLRVFVVSGVTVFLKAITTMSSLIIMVNTKF